ncbi:MAG: YoaK family protein [Candidatus Dormibacteraceae bacterium]
MEVSPRLGWRLPELAGPRHGPLPYFLLAQTAITGMVDAVSVLRLGRVFVANMTGNIVFIGFSLARAPGISLVASLVALAGFLVGAGAGGWLIASLAVDRGRLLQVTAATETVLLLVATVLTAFALPRSAFVVYVLAALLALAMGLQNAAARKLAVPDQTTTVLTMTLTGIAADLRTGERPVAVLRRLLSVAIMLAGAAVGALLVLGGNPALSLLIATVVAAVVVGGLGVVLRDEHPWRRAQPGAQPPSSPRT